MKKLFFLAAIMVFGIFTMNAQKSSSVALYQGTYLIEVNTGSWTTGSTAISFSSVDGFTQYSVGIEGGYFIKENLALKAGVGYSGSDAEGPGTSTLNYKVGAKYYIIGKIPLGVDYTGTSFNDVDENPSYVGVQAGYAWFVADNISIEPTVRYNVSMNSDFYESGIQGLVGFAIHL